MMLVQVEELDSRTLWYKSYRADVLLTSDGEPRTDDESDGLVRPAHAHCPSLRPGFIQFWEANTKMLNHKQSKIVS